MSSLRKQEIRRKTRKRGISSSSSYNPWMKVLAKIGRIPVAAAIWVGGMCRKYPRASIISGSVFGAILAITWATTSIYNAMENRLPTSVSIYSKDDAVVQRINQIAWRTLQEAKARKQSRSEFLTTLSARVAIIENIDDFQVRAGLDKKLQIWATPQTPAFVLEGAEGQRVIISTRMLAVTSLATGAVSPGLPAVVAPEVKISQKINATKEKGTHAISVSGINLPWIYRQVKLVTNAVPEFAAQNFQVDGFVWKQATGLSVRLAKKSEAGQSLSSAVTSVNLGDSNIEAKIERLVKIVAHFSAKNMVPEIVDLNFPDRAIIRMGLSDAGTAVSF